MSEVVSGGGRIDRKSGPGAKPGSTTSPASSVELTDR